MPTTLQTLAQHIGAELRGDGAAQVTGCATISEAGPGDVTFLANARYAGQLAQTKAAAVVVAPQDADKAAGNIPLLIAQDPYFAFRQAMVALIGFRAAPPTGIDPRAVVAESATLGQNCTVGAYAVIDERVTLGDRCILHPHVYVGPDAVIGNDCILYPGVCVYDRCILGDRVTLHAGCSIGQDGFGYATHAGEHHKIPPAGNAVVEDDVEMGAHCSIDRATMGSTIIGRGTKFSNAVTIGHGCRIGRCNLFVAQVGVAGSVETGDYVVLGGKVGVAGHIRIGHRVRAAAMTGIFRNVPDDATIGGIPSKDIGDMKRSWLHIDRLPDLADRVRDLEKKVRERE